MEIIQLRRIHYCTFAPLTVNKVYNAKSAGGEIFYTADDNGTAFPVAVEDIRGLNGSSGTYWELVPDSKMLAADSLASITPKRSRRRTKDSVELDNDGTTVTKASKLPDGSVQISREWVGGGIISLMTLNEHAFKALRRTRAL